MRPLGEQRILVTGSTDGLGRRVAAELAARGATVLVHGRDEDKVADAVREIGARDGLVADLASLDQVRRLAAEAGQTTLLLERLREPARIVNVSSIGQAPLDFDDPGFERGYDAYTAYARSKLAQVLFTVELAERLRDRQITVNALHPATLMDTKMVRQTLGRARTSVEEGVDAVMRLVTDPALDGISGRYFEGGRDSAAHEQAYDPDARRRLWDLSERHTGLAAVS